ncbi:hypothetical protein SNS2_1844 [Streptomyces netropsis]|nr:hypothetical protein SNS2_1844 [Streptomyces netropsis]
MPITLRAGVLQAPTEYGIALLDEDTGRYWTLNPTAASVLRTLLAGGTHQDAARVLYTDYDTDPETATADVLDLLDELRAAHLIEA